MSFQESIPGLATGIPVRQCRRVSGIKRRVFAAIHTRFGRDITPASAKIVRPDRGGISGDDPRAANNDLHCEERQDVGVNSDTRWNEILPPALDKHFGSLPLLTDEAEPAGRPWRRATRRLSQQNGFVFCQPPSPLLSGSNKRSILI